MITKWRRNYLKINEGRLWFFPKRNLHIENAEWNVHNTILYGVKSSVKVICNALNGFDHHSLPRYSLCDILMIEKVNLGKMCEVNVASKSSRSLGYLIAQSDHGEMDVRSITTPMQWLNDE